MKKLTISPDKVRAIMFDPAQQAISGNYINLYPGDLLYSDAHPKPVFTTRPTTPPALRAGKKK